MDILVQFAILVPVVLGVVQVIKIVGLPIRFAPLLSLVLGVVGAFLIGGVSVGLIILQGIMAGLSASGLWSSVKSTFSSQL